MGQHGEPLEHIQFTTVEEAPLLSSRGEHSTAKGLSAVGSCWCV